jgi:hypothetical protein
MGTSLIGPRGAWPRNVNFREFPPNAFNGCLNEEAQVWRHINACGGLKALCPGHNYTEPPWVKMPPQGKRFGHPSSISLPAADGADHVVQSFMVPLGYDGVIAAPVNLYTGQGFVEASGVLTWRIQLGLRYVKDYGAITTSMGSLTQPYYNANSQILLQSGMLVQYSVNRVAGDLTLIGGRVICGLWGWYWPR